MLAKVLLSRSNGHAFLGFNGLVQTVIEAAAIPSDGR